MVFRNAEALMGAVTCLPGVLTMFNFDALSEVAKDYFYQPPIESTFEFCRRYLGEDRYMTHILMERPGTHVLGFNPRAIVKTEAPSTFYNLLRQRRRWFLGTISNEIIMLCTPLFWIKYPFLCVVATPRARPPLFLLLALSLPRVRRVLLVTAL
jgi:cellulose synthase/poly-beta-1,6-N-acetylglucosamine synthase-like glycosyltransferase